MYQFVQQEQHTFTKAPMTPKLVSLKYSKGLDLLVVLRKGYKYKGIWAAKKKKSRMKESFLGILNIHKSVNFGAQQIVILYTSTVRRKFEPFAFTQDEGYYH